MARNKNVIIEKDINRTTGLACILLFDEYNGVCESLNEDNTHKVSFENMLQIAGKIRKFQKEGYSFQFKGFDF
jgi:hypothetical protein